MADDSVRLWGEGKLAATAHNGVALDVTSISGGAVVMSVIQSIFLGESGN